MSEAVSVALRIETACEQNPLQPATDDLAILTRLWPTFCREIAALRSTCSGTT